MPSRRSPRRPAVSPRRRAVYGALLAALDHLLEEGVPRATLAHLEHQAVREWERLFGLSETVVQALLQRPALVADDRPGAGSDPALTQLVVCASALVQLARRAGVLDGPGAPPPLGALRDAVAAAYRYSQRARDRGLLAALTAA